MCFYCVLLYVTLCYYMYYMFIMFVLGIVGYFLRKFDYPLAPLIITFLLGRQFEASLGQSLILGDGSFSIFIDHPIALIFIVLSAMVVIFGSRKGFTNKFN